MSSFAWRSLATWLSGNSSYFSSTRLPSAWRIDASVGGLFGSFGGGAAQRIRPASADATNSAAKTNWHSRFRNGADIDRMENIGVCLS